MAIGMVLAGTLRLIANRYAMSMRSSSWNQAIPVLEAGVEEAMTHMRDDANPTDNGWTASVISGSTVYQKKRTFPDGSYFNATIYSPSSNTPSIIAQGYVPMPMKANQYVARTVLVETTNPPNVFTKAIATIGTITFNGSNPSADSYDSGAGAYDAVTNHGSLGNLATDSTNKPAVDLGGGTVNGSVTTGPGGTITGGTITGGTNNNMNVSFPSNYPPGNASSFMNMPNPGLLTILGITGYNLSSGSYQAANFSSSGAPLIINGNVTLYVSGSFDIAGQGYIEIKKGASLTLYVGGNLSIAGNGVLNDPGFAGNFNILGLAGCTSMSYTGNGTFVGTVYAPEADVAIKGNGGIYGAIIAKTATLSGNANFHYDSELAKIGGLVATSWTEL